MEFATKILFEQLDQQLIKQEQRIEEQFTVTQYQDFDSYSVYQKLGLMDLQDDTFR